jgi:protein phosphatase 1 regulatory subunit 42
MVRICTDLIVKGTTLRRKKDEDDDALVKRVTHVNLSAKKIAVIENLECCPNLQCLYLYENRIQKIQNLDFGVNLTHLYLQDNCIETMENFTGLINLRKLFLGGNYISEVTGLSRCMLLQELHVQAQNMPAGKSLRFNIDSLQAISESLQVLNVQKNNMSEISSLRYLRYVEKLDLSMNNIDSFDEIGSLFRHDGCANISALETKGNPIDKQHRFRDYVMMMAPSLATLNGREITHTERQFVMNREAVKQQARGRADGDPPIGRAGDAFDGVQVCSRCCRASYHLAPSLPLDSRHV